MQVGLLTIFNPRDRNVTLYIDYKQLAKNYEAQKLIKNRDIRSMIALCYQGTALLDDLQEEPVLGPQLTYLIDNNILCRKKAYPDYRWVFDYSAVPEELSSLLKDKKFKEDLENFIEVNGEDFEKE